MPNSRLLILLIATSFLTSSVYGQDVAKAQEKDPPLELSVIKSSIGTWDSEIEVWPQGLDKPSIKFKGVETNRPYGNHWMASDFDSEFGGQTVKVHSIIGYDLDKKKLVGTVIDHGPYSATMTGSFNPKTKTVTWKTTAKDLDGSKMIQRTTITQKSDDVRILELSMPSGEENKYNKFMKIKFTKRKSQE